MGFNDNKCNHINLINIIILFYKVCRIYGFKKKHNPIIYKTDGTEIGDKDNFFELIEIKYGIKAKDVDFTQRNIKVK